MLLESSLYFAGHADEDDETKDDDKAATTFRWTIDGHPGQMEEGGATWHTGLIGEIFVCREGWHLIVAAALQVEGRAERFKECLGSADVEACLGYWASHILWDFVSVEANRLLVGARVGFALPVATPRPQLRSELPDADDDETEEGPGAKE